MTPEQLGGTEERARRACAPGARGTAVRYLRAIWVPGDWRVMYLFEAPDAAAVEAVCRMAQIPFLRVVQAVEITRGDEGGQR
jgi:muconolactone delta-isomerase